MFHEAFGSYCRSIFFIFGVVVSKRCNCIEREKEREIERGITAGNAALISSLRRAPQVLLQVGERLNVISAVLCLDIR